MRRSLLTAIFWLASAAAIEIFADHSALWLIAWSVCMSLYFISFARSVYGKYRTPPPDSYHPSTEKDTKANSRTRAITSAIAGASTYTIKAITGGTARANIVHDDLPILAVKRVDFRINPYNNKVFIVSIGYNGAPDGFDCDAKCRINLHKAPQWDCHCGFYAVPPDRIDDFRLFGNYIVEVELSGVVIETEFGYRAQHQKTIGIYRDYFGHDYHIERLIEEQTGIKVKPYDHLRKS